MKTPRSRTAAALAALAITTLPLAACGGDDGEADEATSPTHTVASVTDCFEGAGQKVREVELSFAKIPPDIGASSREGSVTIWVTDDEAAAQDVAEQGEELSKLGDQDLPDSERVVSGNAVASISSTSSPSYAEIVEECLPASG